MLNIFQTQSTVEACRINMIACLAEMECILPTTEMPLSAVHYNRTLPWPETYFEVACWQYFALMGRGTSYRTAKHNHSVEQHFEIWGKDSKELGVKKKVESDKDKIAFMQFKFYT